MRCGNGRIIRPEWLDDHAAGNDKSASLHDIVRINRIFGGHAVLRHTMARIVRPDEAFSFLDVGAASGDMGRELRSQYPKARVTSLDYRIDHLRPAPDPRVVGDAFRLPFADGSFDFVHSSLFLHHFSNDQVTALLKGFGRVSRRAVVVTDLERHIMAYYALPLTRWIFDWNPITLHDGPISVEAGFHAGELKKLAHQAGFEAVDVQVHRPAFRLSLIGRVVNSLNGS